ncbi:MAG TPA: GNAT family N-acetyltransferase [Caulobacteraceae bacterium]|nr:GNAT family N-acetyltransferase [Caulobacteraceae bacterium]
MDADRLFHFSEDPAIEVFEPRPVLVPSQRPPGLDWLNGPLVWAIDAWHAPMFFFPRDCPRITLWRTPQTTEADLDHWWRGDRRRRMQAHIEAAWLQRFNAGELYRYVFDPSAFERVEASGGPGYYVAREAVRPLAVEPVGDLGSALDAAGAELHVMHDLLPFNGAWDSTLHFSGSRLRNAVGWEARDAPALRPLRLQLRTERLTLRPFELSDAARVAEILSNWNVTRMIAMASWPATLDGERAWLATHVEDWRAGSAYRFAVIRQGALIGCADVDEIAGDLGEIGYWFDEAAWGCGYATEAARGVMDFARRSLGIARFKSGHAADNPASGAVLRKLGFQAVGERELFYRPRQALVRRIRYALGRPAAA